MLKENDPINDRLDKISETVVFLTEKITSLEERMNKAEEFKKEPRVSIDIPPKPMYAASEIATAAPIKPETIFVPGSGSKFYVEKEKVKETARKESFETEIGLKWLGRIGILALIVGVAFFLKYAFDNDWIGEAGRVAIGILSGMVLIYLGDFLRQKYTSYAAILTGGGIAVLYLSIYSGFAYYQLIDRVPAFIAMMIITAIGAFLAIRYERINLAVLSILGGFLTPILLSTGINNQIGLFSYMTILNLGVLAVSFYRNWQKLNLLGFIATLFLYFGWSVQHYDASQLFLTEAFLTLWFIIYSVAVVSHNILSKKKADVFDMALIILNGLAYFSISYFLLVKEYGDYLGFFAVLLAAVYFIFAYVSYQMNPEDKKLALFFPGLSIFFLTVSAPIQFDGVWVTIAWAVEAVILIKAGFLLKSGAFRFFAWALLGIAVIRLIFIDNYEIVSAADYILIFNKRFLTFIAGAASFAGVYYLYSQHEALVKSKELKAKAAALFFINFLLLWNLSAEVSVYFSNQINFLNMSAIYPQCRMWDYDSRGNYMENTRCAQQIKEYNAAQSINSLKIKNIQSTETALLTVLWSLYAIGLLAFGIRGKNRLLRLMGIGLFGIAIAKLFLYGFLAMQGIYRIIAFVVLGALLLAASFAYNKYKEKIKEII